jgi:hypothetical protein
LKQSEDKTIAEYALEKEYWRSGKYIKPKKRKSNLSIVKNLNKEAA